ncbi:hypothetical protein ACWEWG_40335 [Streptomyces sp. NPDC003758]|uniref:Uncharacterized protein n=1 Tax=Streptomyces cynarae TaxID=2981134 RepID=A0ABY6E869_9ACTN|nr:hypothetical protein [Streptomyces cynarae]UXY22885.1 hypothetical protein N8I84_32405 [Streptomyces cynarae]
MNRLELGLALGIAYALGRRSRTKTLEPTRTATAGRDPGVERLEQEVRAYLLTRAQPLLAVLGRKVGALSVRLNDIAEGNSPALRRVALAVGRHVTRSRTRSLPAAGPEPRELEEGSGP